MGIFSRFIEHRLPSDRQTDRQRAIAHAALLSSRGKNGEFCSNGYCKPLVENRMLKVEPNNQRGH